MPVELLVGPLSAIIEPMDSSLPVNGLYCTQCGGELHPDEGQIFLTCPYCNSTVYVDKSRVVFHWYLAPTLDEAKAHASLARWMAGNQTVKDLDKKAMITGGSFEFFPLWYFKRRWGDGNEKILIEPAAATSVSELRRLKLPAGDLRKYDPALDPQAHLPTVPLQTALSWLPDGDLRAGGIAEMALVHVPLYTFKYTYLGNPFTALVDGATGEVFANIYPAKEEVPYLMVGGLTGLTFLCLATFPLIGALFGGDNWVIGLGTCLGLGALAVPALFTLAVWVAAKV